LCGVCEGRVVRVVGRVGTAAPLLVFVGLFLCGCFFSLTVIAVEGVIASEISLGVHVAMELEVACLELFVVDELDAALLVPGLSRPCADVAFLGLHVGRDTAAFLGLHACVPELDVAAVELLAALQTNAVPLRLLKSAGAAFLGLVPAAGVTAAFSLGLLVLGLEHIAGPTVGPTALFGTGTAFSGLHIAGSLAGEIGDHDFLNSSFASLSWFSRSSGEKHPLFLELGASLAAKFVSFLSETSSTSAEE